jgi:outer membrane protein TolC
MKLYRAWAVSLAALLLAWGKPVIAQQEIPRRLSLKEAIELALKNNLSVRVAGTQVEELMGTRERREASLLPHVSGNLLANRQNVNLGALGFTSIPNIPIPSVIPAFNHYDSRILASQPLIDREAYHNLKATEKQVQASKLTYQDTRDLVVRETAGLYLDSEVGLAEVAAAESRVTTSQALEKLARDQHDQGLATAVDLVRAQVQLARDRQTLLVERDAYQTSLLALARFMGISPGTPLELAGHMEFHPVPAPPIDEALRTALEARSDYRSLLTERQSLVEQEKAARARYFPKLSVNGDYGALGTAQTMAGIGEIQGTISISLFDWDRTGQRKELESQVRRLNEQIDDLTRGIEQDLRKALLDLDSTASQVSVTESALTLAERELALAQDRFRNGVTDNIEVVTAQDTLASAQDDRIMALARHTDAGMALARALGDTEKIYQTYLGEP